MIDPIALSIPAFVLLMLAELGASWATGRLGGDRPTWRAIDALTDLGCGVFSQVTGLVLSAVVFAGGYVGLHRHLALLDLDPTPAVWAATFMAVDLCYYGWHRASHRVNALWAAHVVHHQSEDFNLAVALRQGTFTPLTSLPFYAPLAVAGVPPEVFLTCSALNTVGQFWFHTRLIDRLGPLEWVLNTPSHHRVHHGVDPAYIDKNHAGIFIVWDHLFGTFAPETTEPRYGVVTAHRSASVLSAQLDPWTQLFALARRCHGLDRLRAWFAPPEWRPAHLGGPIAIPSPSTTLRWRPSATRPRLVLAITSLVATSTALVFLLDDARWPSVAPRALAGLLTAWSVVSWGHLLDDRPWARSGEAVRLVVAPALALTLHPLAAAAAALHSLICAACLRADRASEPA